MNTFDRAVNKKSSFLISKNSLDNEIDEDEYRKFKMVAKAIIREESRELKPNNKPKSLYSKTWKTAKKYSGIKK